MGFFSDAWKGVKNVLDGGADKAADAQEKAGEQAQNTQLQMQDRIIAENRRTNDLIRSDFAPYRKVGTDNLGALQKMLTGQGQADFVTSNPLFAAMMNQSKDQIFANNAARGKLGSGDTAAALQDRFLAQGQGFADNQFNKLFEAVRLGQNSAAQTGSAAQNSAANSGNAMMNAGNNISGLQTQIGNSRAAGIVAGTNNLSNNLFQPLMGAGAGALMGSGALGAGASGAAGGSAGIGALMGLLSDRRMKTDIKVVGKLDNGLPVYSFKYKGQDVTHIGLMAQDVQAVNPDAVIERDGVLYVNYAEAA